MDSDEFLGWGWHVVRIATATLLFSLVTIAIWSFVIQGLAEVGGFDERLYWLVRVLTCGAALCVGFLLRILGSRGGTPVVALGALCWLLATFLLGTPLGIRYRAAAVRAEVQQQLADAEWPRYVYQHDFANLCRTERCQGPVPLKRKKLKTLDGRAEAIFDAFTPAQRSYYQQDVAKRTITAYNAWLKEFQRRGMQLRFSLPFLILYLTAGGFACAGAFILRSPF